MKFSSTLSSYIGRQFLLWFGIAFVSFSLIVLLFDAIELLRRAAAKEQATFGIVLQMALFKLPHMTQLLIPFAILFGGMLAFWRLTRSQELVVARAAGISVWQFLFPALALAFLIGAIKITLLGPFSSIMTERFEEMESTYLELRPSTLTVSSSGLWLRQIDPKGRSLIHAQRVIPKERRVEEVTVFKFEGTGHFVERIDAPSATLHDGYWELDAPWITAPTRPPERKPSLTIETDLTWRKIEDSFDSPETLSFWELPGFIEVLEAAGFPALRHRLYYQGMLASPFLLCAMVLIGATFSLRPNRRGGMGHMVAGGVLAGFVLYIASDLVFALGLSGRIPIKLAAWAPAGICMLLGIATLFHLEDG